MSRYLLASALLLCAAGAAALDDPMRPPMAAGSTARRAQAEQPGHVLSSTYIARERRVAVINGKSVSVGDRVGDAEVTEILPTEVRLRQGEKELVVRLLPVSVKTPATTGKQEQQ